jgi:ABC-2 type transport system ATP-binding protein
MTPSSPPVVHVRGLKKTYKGKIFRSGFCALGGSEGIDLKVDRGSVFGLLGPNGAGKTTLVKILLGLVRASGGEADLLGEPAGRAGPRARVGYLPEAHRLPIYLTGREMLRLSGMMVGRSKAWIDTRSGPWLERLAMTASADRKIKEYSKGMMQRIGLVQALIHEPEVVFLDEPTDGVDPVGRAAIREVVTELAQAGTTIFINSHLLMEVEMICDKLMILMDGEVLKEGSLADLTPDNEQVQIYVSKPPPGDLQWQTELGTAAEGMEITALDEAEIWRVALKTDDEGLNRVIDKLRADGIPISQVRRDRRTLEDVFIDLVGGGGKL